MKKSKNGCSYCNPNIDYWVTKNAFQVINMETMDYSGIEIALNRQGMLRIRTYAKEDTNFNSQDMINIKYCPMCGEEFKY